MAVTIEEVQRGLNGLGSLGSPGVWHRRPQLRTALPLVRENEVMSGRNVGLSGLGGNALRAATRTVKAVTEAQRAGVNITPADTMAILKGATKGTATERMTQAANIVKAVTAQAKMTPPGATYGAPPARPTVKGPSVTVPALSPNAQPPPPPVTTPLVPGPAPAQVYTPPPPTYQPMYQPTYQPPVEQPMFAPTPTSNMSVPYITDPAATYAPAPAASGGIPLPYIIGGGLGVVALLGVALMAGRSKREAAQ